jgi:hypothetical protein
VNVSRATRGVWTAAVAVGLIIASGCGLGDDADQRGEPDAPPSGDQGRLLDEVEYWLYLIDVDLEPDTVDEIVESEHDLVVLDFIASEQQNTD